MCIKAESDKSAFIVEKFLKKSVDKRMTRWYNNKAVGESGRQRTLKTEQQKVRRNDFRNLSTVLTDERKISLIPKRVIL